jgi:hypothetical protein
MRDPETLKRLRRDFATAHSGPAEQIAMRGPTHQHNRIYRECENAKRSPTIRTARAIKSPDGE